MSSESYKKALTLLKIIIQAMKTKNQIHTPQKLIILILCGILFSVFACKEAPQRANTENIKRKWLDVPYAKKSQFQKLDIYLPDTGNGPFPVIIAIHGGAFMTGDKTDLEITPMLQGLKRGYAVVSINYRLSAEVQFPKQIHDVKAAVRWIRANAMYHNLDPHKIAAWGSSAGGYLSTMLGTTGYDKEMEDLTLGNLVESSNVQAVVDWFGPTDFLQMDAQLKESKVKNPILHSVPESPESKFIGKNISIATDLVNQSNPENYISKFDPPFFIQHGKLDNLVPYQQSNNLANKLELVLGKENVTFELIESAGHGGSQFNSPQNLNKVFEFLDRHLKQP